MAGGLVGVNRNTATLYYRKLRELITEQISACRALVVRKGAQLPLHGGFEMLGADADIEIVAPCHLSWATPNDILLALVSML